LENTESPIPASDIAGLVELIETDVISSKIAREVFEHMWAGEGAPAAIVEARGMRQVSDTGALETMIEALIAANPGQAAAVKEKPQAIGWFVGQVMKQTSGKANPAAVNEILRAKLGV
jgi:aspartyl-tRNA(Asn)/glutamyl-tRNA(Gln) amidotransferase subunit B